MKKILLNFLLLFLLTGCVGIYTAIDYRVKSINDKDFSFNYEFGQSYIKSKKRDLYLSLKFLETPNKNSELLEVDFSILSSAHSELNIEILNDVIIFKENKNNIIINEKEIIYEIRRARYDKNRKNLHIFLKIPEKLKGKIKINFGKVRIGEKIFEIPEIIMQRYKISESNTLTEALLNESGENIQFYHNEDWIEE